MAPTAAYDEIADWYEQEFLGGHATGARTSDGNPLDLGGLLSDLLGEGDGVCLEIGCGTGVHAAQVRELGWAPLGVDLSAGMLRHARGRALRGKRRASPRRTGRQGTETVSTGLTAEPGFHVTNKQAALQCLYLALMSLLRVHPGSGPGFLAWNWILTPYRCALSALAAAGQVTAAGARVLLA